MERGTARLIVVGLLAMALVLACGGAGSPSAPNAPAAPTPSPGAAGTAAPTDDGGY
jgi:hypothetical protein